MNAKEKNNMLKFLIESGYDVKAPQREAGNAGVDFFRSLDLILERLDYSQNTTKMICKRLYPD